MNPTVTQIVARWAGIYNRRRLAEEAMRWLGWCIGGVAVLVGLAAVSIAASLPSWTLGVLVGAGVAWAGILVPVFGLRFLRRRTDPESIALAVDQELATHDLVATALAVESHRATGDPVLGDLVLARARRSAPGLGVAAVGVLVTPWLSLVVALVLFLLNGGTIAAVSVLKSNPELLASLPLPSRLLGTESVEIEPEASDTDEEPGRELSDEVVSALGRDAAALEEALSAPGLSPESREAIGEALQHMRDALRQDGSGRETLDALDKVTRALEKLDRLARAEQDGATGDDPSLFGDEELARESHDEVAKAMSDALKRGDTAEAERLSQELARRAREGTDSEVRSMGEALSRAARDMAKTGEGERGEPGDPSSRTGSTPEARAARRAASEAANRAAKSAFRGDRSGAAAELERLAEEMAKATRRAGRSGTSTERSISRALDDARRARGEQLDALAAARARANQKGGKKPGEEGSSPDSEGEMARSEAGSPGSTGSEGARSSSGSESRGSSGSEPGRSASEAGSEGAGSEGASSKPGGREGSGSESEGSEGASSSGERPGAGDTSRPGSRPGEEGSPSSSGAGSESPGRGGEAGSESKEGSGPSRSGTEGRGGREGFGITRSGATESGGEGATGSPTAGPGHDAWGRPIDPSAVKMPDNPAEWIASKWSGAPDGMMSIIEAGARGDRASAGYREVHHSYSAVAESATEREEIPLTRRDYIRRYFEAIRPE